MILPTAISNLVKNKSDQPHWYALASNSKKKHLDIYMYGVIGGWSNNVNNFTAELKQAGNIDTIAVYLNTVGGSFYDGLAIHNTLKQHSAHVTIKVMGYALSMGSYLLTAADKAECAANGLIMAHRAQGGAWGDAARLEHVANVLIKHENASLIPDFMKALNKSESEVRALLNKETWWTAKEAKAAGLIHNITDEVDLDDAEDTLADNAWEFAADNFQNPRKEFTNRIDNYMTNQQKEAQPWLLKLLNKVVGDPQNIPSDNNTDESDDDMTPDQIEALATAVGNKVTEANQPVVDALNKLSEKPPEPTAPEPNPAPSNESDAELETVKAENTDLKTQLETLTNKVAELEGQSDPDLNNDDPENLGPDGAKNWEQKKYDC